MTSQHDTNSPPFLSFGRTLLAALTLILFVSPATFASEELLNLELAFADSLIELGWHELAAQQYDRLLEGRTLLDRKPPPATAASIQLKVAELKQRQAREAANLSLAARVALLKQSLERYDLAIPNLQRDDSGKNITEATLERLSALRDLAEQLSKWADEAATPEQRNQRLSEAAAAFQQAIDKYSEISTKMAKALDLIYSWPMSQANRERSSAEVQLVQAQSDFARLQTRYLLSKLYRIDDPNENALRKKALEETIKEAQEFADTWPDSALFGLLYKAAALNDLNRYAEALKALESAVNEPAAEYYPELHTAQQAALFQAAIAAFELGKYDDVLSITSKYAEWYPNALNSQWGLEVLLLKCRAQAASALLMRDQGKPDTEWKPLLQEAVSTAERLARTDSQVSARSRFHVGEWVALLDAPLSFSQATAAAYQTLLRSADRSLTPEQKNQTLEKAVEHYRTAILIAQTREPTVKPLALADAYFNLGRCYFFLDRKLEAAIAFKEAGRLTPSDASLTDERGQPLKLSRYRFQSRMLWDLSNELKSQTAKRLYEQAVHDEDRVAEEMFATIPDVSYRTGAIAEAKREFLKAIEHYHKVTPISEYYPRALHNIGRCYVGHTFALVGEDDQKPAKVACILGPKAPQPYAGLFEGQISRQPQPNGNTLIQGTTRSLYDFFWWAMRAGNVTITAPPELVAKAKEFDQSARKAAQAINQYLEFAQRNFPSHEKEQREQNELIASAQYLLAVLHMEPPFDDPAKVRQILANYTQKPEAAAYAANAALLSLRAAVKLGLLNETMADLTTLEAATGVTDEQLATAYRLACNLILQEADKMRAQNQTARASELTEQSVPLLKKLIQKDPNQPFRFYANLFIQFFQQGDYAAAAQIGRTITERFKDEAQYRDELLQISERIAVALCKTGQCEQGIASLKQRSEYYASLEDQYKQQNRPFPARERSAQWFVNKSLADCYLQCNQFSDAITYYNRVRRGIGPDTPQFWEVHLNMATAAFQLGDLDAVQNLLFSLRFQIPAAPPDVLAQYIDFLNKFIETVPEARKPELLTLLQEAQQAHQGPPPKQ